MLILTTLNFCEYFSPQVFFSNFPVRHAYQEFSDQSEQENSIRVPTQRPYIIKNKKYIPQNHLYYDQIGIASWYGPNFHNRLTSSGKIFNMHKLTAAHATLPLNSVVRVTNLNNGRSIDVIVNDHGPFHKDRIIDLSKRAAQVLGFHQQGITPVRVQCLFEASRKSIFKKNYRQINKKTVRKVCSIAT